MRSAHQPLNRSPQVEALDSAVWMLVEVNSPAETFLVVHLVNSKTLIHLVGPPSPAAAEIYLAVPLLLPVLFSAAPVRPTPFSGAPAPKLSEPSLVVSIKLINCKMFF